MSLIVAAWKNWNALAWQICIFEARSREFERKLMDLNSSASSKSWSWKRKQQLVWDLSLVACGKENAQWYPPKKQNNIRFSCWYPSTYSSIVTDYHESLCLFISPLLFISHMFVTLRNSAERGRQTSLCLKSFVLCVSFSRITTKVVWEKVKKMKSIWYEGVPQCVRIHTHKERDIHMYIFLGIIAVSVWTAFRWGSMLD